MKCKSGFVIPMVLLLIGMAMVLAVGIFQRGVTFAPYISAVLKREQAKQLALSGVHIAMSQIAYADSVKQHESSEPKQTEKNGEKKEEAKGPSREELVKAMFSNMLSHLNEWQTFQLKESIDGINGTIKIALSCEEGKINLNKIYDFSKKRFIGEGQLQFDWKKMMELIMKRIEKKMHISGNMFESFEKFFKERQYRVNDPSELLTYEHFKRFAHLLFYEPPQKAEKDRPIFLFDIFTVYGNDKLQLWFLSDSVRDVLEMKRAVPVDQKAKKDMVQELLKKLKPTVAIAADWNTIFQPLYGIEFKRLPKGIEGFLDTTFDPKIFSVVSYGIVGNITQRVYAILERIRRTDKNKTWYDVKIRKFYWI